VRFMHYIVALGLVLAGVSSQSYSAPSGEDSRGPRLEIKKFRFSRHKRRNYERLVIEFAAKGNLADHPQVKINSGAGDREASIHIEPGELVGAIPESLINDSYVPKSRFLGPISFNTDGPSPGFEIRTYLKEKVSVEAMWLQHPARLVLDVFPGDSPRVQGPGFETRGIASDSFPSGPGPSASMLRTPASVEDQSPIICFPVSSQVNAIIGFHPRGMPQTSSLINTDALQTTGGGQEPVICYLTSSQVSPNISFQPKGQQYPTFVQMESNSGFQRPPASLMGAPGLGGTPPLLGAPPPGAMAGPKTNGIPDMTPGRAQVGTPLANPNTVKQQNGFPARPPGFGDAAGTAAPVPGRAAAPLGMGSLVPGH
jgi:hypothetical protein